MLASCVIDSSPMVHNLIPFVCFDTKGLWTHYAKKERCNSTEMHLCMGWKGGDY